MEDVDHTGKLDRVDCPVGIAVVVFDDLEQPRHTLSDDFVQQLRVRKAA
jgi:hypothetical protein